MAMAPGERDAVRAQRQAEFEPATRCGCTRPLEPLESHIHRFPAAGAGSRAGGRWVHRPPATSSATAADTTLRRRPRPLT
jgi:hypothetical protein